MAIRCIETYNMRHIDISFTTPNIGHRGVKHKFSFLLPEHEDMSRHRLIHEDMSRHWLIH